jgi:hypothetical protein
MVLGHVSEQTKKKAMEIGNQNRQQFEQAERTIINNMGV